MSQPMVSHGRGGAANIRKDTMQYVDGAIIRQGPQGDQGSGLYSAGRGGRGNVKSTSNPPDDQDAVLKDALKFEDIVPHEAIRLGNTSDYHIGRGGEGNRRNIRNDATDPQPVSNEQSLADKLKNKLIRRKSENASPKPDARTVAMEGDPDNS